MTPKQENFCLTYVECGNASEAYRRCYDASRMKPESVHRKAKELLDNGKVSARIAELREQAIAAHSVTVESLTADARKVFQAALDNGQLTAANSSLTLLARMRGLMDGAGQVPMENKRFSPVERASRVLDLLRRGGRE